MGEGWAEYVDQRKELIGIKENNEMRDFINRMSRIIYLCCK
jgi:hypothetical protein